MPNPMFGNATSPNGATAPNDSLNNSTKKYRRGYNKFNLTRQFYNTERYADINLIEVLEGVEGDSLPFGNKHEIRTFTLGSPIMFDVYKKKSYFMVDNSAILPRNWEKIYKQPNKGDDVSVDVNSVTRHFFYFLSEFQSKIYDNEIDYFCTKNTTSYTALFKYLLFLESIFSNGSLLSSMNYHCSPMVNIKSSVDSNLISKDSFDDWLEKTFKLFSDTLFSVDIPSINSQFTNLPSASSPYTVLSFRELLDLCRTFDDFSLVYDSSLSSNFDAVIERLKLLSFKSASVGASPAGVEDSKVIFDFKRLIAYQLVCCQFYTNDSVDNIYTQELFMQNAESIVESAIGTSNYFIYNGVRTHYDVFSGHTFEKMLTAMLNTTSVDDFLACYPYFHLIFFFRKSLRYGDYFVGAKTLPYAPGDVTADVVGNGVSALDITRKTLMLRFLNQVERAKNTFKDYLKDVTDGIAPPNKFEPRFLASSTSRVTGFEVENTAEDQGDIVTILRSGDSKYMYEVNVGSPCIIIGVSTYEVPRVYSATVDRFFKHRDRFDMFNKFMQNIGDQEIKLNERSSAFGPTSNFAYTPRHMEYKQRYPYASGGFVQYLKGYAFITDNSQSGQDDTNYGTAGRNITSFYIRNRNSEFDRFYKSLTGLTLASYFHFICKYDNICHASRLMEYSPSIL